MQCRRPAGRTGHTCRRRKPRRRFHEADGLPTGGIKGATGGGIYFAGAVPVKAAAAVVGGAPGAAAADAAGQPAHAPALLGAAPSTAEEECIQCQFPTRRKAHTCGRAATGAHVGQWHSPAEECVQCLFPTRRKAHTCGRGGAVLSPLGLGSPPGPLGL